MKVMACVNCTRGVSWLLECAPMMADNPWCSLDVSFVGLQLFKVGAQFLSIASSTTTACSCMGVGNADFALQKGAQKFDSGLLLTTCSLVSNFGSETPLRKSVTFFISATGSLLQLFHKLLL